MRNVSPDILSTTCPVLISLSKNAMSCLRIDLRYRALIRAACLSPVIVQHDTSIKYQISQSRKEWKECSSSALKITLYGLYTYELFNSYKYIKTQSFSIFLKEKKSMYNSSATFFFVGTGRAGSIPEFTSH
jgi:hypothetical protein